MNKVKSKLRCWLPKSPALFLRKLAGMNPREVVEHGSKPANLLIHGLAWMQEPEYIHSSEAVTQRQNNSLEVA